MSNKYVATYKIGNATVHIVAPPPMSDEEIEAVLRKYHEAGRMIIEDLMRQADYTMLDIQRE